MGKKSPLTPIGAQPQNDQTTGIVPASQRGAIFTRRWIVDLMLDLAGYIPEADLSSKVAVEPACGSGAFVDAMVQRIIASCKRHGRDISDASHAIAAYDIDLAAVKASRQLIAQRLTRSGVPSTAALTIAEKWISHSDFLCEPPEPGSIDFVVGNPPYVRLEDVPHEKMPLYRAAWKTMTGRADLYVGFIEAGLRGLRAGGSLTYICADRWMRNQYGAALRELVEKEFAMEVNLATHEVDAFEDKVSAYPAIIRIRRSSQGPVLVAEASRNFDEQSSKQFLKITRKSREPHQTLGFRAAWTGGWFNDSGSWPSGTPEQLSLLSRLEKAFPPLEETSAKVRVGVATGADNIFVTSDSSAAEPDRLLRVVAGKDVSGGKIAWPGTYVVNPWDVEGLVSLADYPRMKTFLEANKDALHKRHVAMKRPSTWWRTIDRINVSEIAASKLLIPDLKDRVFPVLDIGEYYPLHSLYYITSQEWDLRVLGGLLLSDIANLFVEAYSVRMANGYLRVSAQYLRRIRVPPPRTIPDPVCTALIDAFETRDAAAANAAARQAYRLGEDLPFLRVERAS